MIHSPQEKRKSFMSLGKVYFWTSSIYQWKHLLTGDYKNLIIDCLNHLSQRNKIVVYAFVIMPNHLHFIWEMLELNGKEMPNASFHKFIAHKIEEDLKITDVGYLTQFYVNEKDRKCRFWQRDALALEVYNKRIFEQKMDYIHLNPLQEHWQLSKKPEDYYYSSAAFYEMGKKDFPFLVDYRERF